MQGQTEALGPLHQRTIGARIALALLLAQQGREEAARLRHFDDALGPQDPDTLKDVRALAALLRGRGEGEEAAALARCFGV